MSRVESRPAEDASAQAALTRATQGLRIALVGAGALGSELARCLIAVGAPHVLVIDPDQLEPRNLALSTLYAAAEQHDPGQLGRGKAELVTALAAQHVPPLSWQFSAAEIADTGLARLRACDLILSATDSTLARLETAYAACLLRLPMIDGGIHGDGTTAGRAALYPAAERAACYSCGLATARRAELLTFANAVALGCQPPADVLPMAGTPEVVQAVARAMLGFVSLLVHSASPEHAVSQTVRGDRAFGGSPLLLTRSATCPWHALPPPAALRTLADAAPLSQLWTAPADTNRIAEPPWPICLSARCQSCGAPAQPMARLAWVRRRLSCAICGATGTLEPLTAVAGIAQADPLAALPARQLGLPDQHLYTMREPLDWTLPDRRTPAEDLP